MISGGSEPVAVTQHADLVYVVNAGGNGNVVGLPLAPWGASRKSPIRRASSAAADLSCRVRSHFVLTGRFQVTQSPRSKPASSTCSGVRDGWHPVARVVFSGDAGPGEFAISFASTEPCWFPKLALPVESTRWYLSSSMALLASGYLTPITTSVPLSERQHAGRWPLQTAALSTRQTPAQLQSPDFRLTPMAAWLRCPVQSRGRTHPEPRISTSRLARMANSCTP